MSSSRFVLRLATVQALCNLARVVLELHHPLLLVAFRESLRELLEVRVAPRHCTGPVQPGTCSSRASSSTAPRRVQGKVFVSSSRFVLRLATVQALCNLARVVLELHRLDEICVPLEVSLSTQCTTLHFLMMSFNIDLPSWRLVLELFLREDVSHAVKHYISESFLVSILALFVSFSSRCFALLLVLQSISDRPPINMFVSIHSTSPSLRERGSDTRHLCIH